MVFLLFEKKKAVTPCPWRVHGVPPRGKNFR